MASKGFDLNGRVVLITGASSGMGRAAALAFAEERARLLLAARRPEEGEVVARAIRAKGGQALFVAADVTREKDVQTVVDATVREYGRLDVAFNNAGTEGLAAPLIDPTNDNYELVMNTNVRSIFWSMQYEIRAMLKTGGGSIINNSSMGAFIGFPNLALYIASKHAVMGLTKSAALEYYQQNIRINAVNPRLIDTPFQDRLWGDSQKKLDFANATPAGRIGTAEEVADSVLFLASERARFYSGQGMVMDGGYTIQ